MSRRDQIIEAALDIFTKDGFTVDFTMSQLAVSIDIGKSTIYEYFSNKDEVIKAAIFKFIENKIVEVNILHDIESVTFEEAFKKQLSVLLKVASESRALLETLSPGFVQKLPEDIRDDMKNRMEETRDRLSMRFMSFFTKAEQEGLIGIETSQEIGLVITSMVVGSIMVFSDSRNKTEISTFVDAVYESVLKILN